MDCTVHGVAKSWLDTTEQLSLQFCQDKVAQWLRQWTAALHVWVCIPSSSTSSFHFLPSAQASQVVLVVFKKKEKEKKPSPANAGDMGSIRKIPWRRAWQPTLVFLPGELISLSKGNYLWASPITQLLKHLPAMQETQDRSMGWEDLLEKGRDTHSSILAWRIPWTLSSMGSQKVGHDWVTFTSTSNLYQR